jgi:hypothetical protein
LLFSSAIGGGREARKEARTVYKSVVKVCVIALGALAIVGQPTKATAAPVSAFEIIGDGWIPELLTGVPDVWRWRVSPDTNEFTANSSLVRSENNVSSSFGKVDWDDVSYTHDLTWVAPPAGTFTSATLTIIAAVPAGNNDNVYVSHDLSFNLLGPLGPIGGTFSDGFITASLNEGGILNVLIDKQFSFNFLSPDFDPVPFAVLGSKLWVEYEPLIAGDPMPEPTALLLLGAGLMGGALRLRRRS